MTSSHGDDLNAADSARLFAMQNLSGADASINCWNDKYHFDFGGHCRRSAGRTRTATLRLHRNPPRTGRRCISAPYPDHTSGHMCQDGAHTTVLRMFFGDVIDGGYQITSAAV